MSEGQSAMNTRKASTSSIASSVGAFSYFSIDTSAKEEPQQSGIIAHFLLSLHKTSILNFKWLNNQSLIHIFTTVLLTLQLSLSLWVKIYLRITINNSCKTQVSQQFCHVWSQSCAGKPRCWREGRGRSLPWPRRIWSSLWSTPGSVLRTSGSGTGSS